MYCKECGNYLDEKSLFCNKCGISTMVIKKSTQANVLSIVGLIVACISFFLNFWGIVGIAAVILSSFALIQINKTGEKGKGMAIAGILIGSFQIIYAFIMILILI